MGFFRTFIEVVAGTTSTLMTMSPISTIYEVHKAKTVGVASISPFVSMFANCHMNILFGYLKELYFPLFSTAVLGDVLSPIYIAVFYYYSQDRHAAHKMFLCCGVPLLLFTIYSVVGGLGLTGQSRFQVGDMVGYFGNIATLALYASPFEKMRAIIRHKSAVFLNIHMICAGSFNMLMWTIYGLTVSEWLVRGPTLFCFIGGCVQMVLYVVYHPSTHPYDGPIPEVVESNDGDVSRTKSKAESPNFVPLVSPARHASYKASTTAEVVVVSSGEAPTESGKPGPSGD